MILKDKKILLGISGSIAAYKIAFLTRLLIKAGAAVKIVMTKAATEFITPLTLSTLSKNPVYSDVSSEQGWNNHVELGLWADVMVIAPATANTLAKMANGMCDNMLLATYLSSRCPVFFAPAMDLDMWVHPATLNNVKRLESYGNQLIPVEDGELASGLYGKGRMAEPEDIIKLLEDYFWELRIKNLPLYGKTAVVTSGPTAEAIDPVRYITNHSTGKMGIAIADALAAQGAQVHLVCGPTKEKPEHKNVNFISVRSAQDMYEASIQHFPSSDIAIFAAAVADYTPAQVANHKIKKKEGAWQIPLKRTKDIAGDIGKLKQKHQITVGFALETQDEMSNAQRKLSKKNLDFIVLNSLQDKGAGFGHNTNKVRFIEAEDKITNFELKSKKEVAIDIVHKICELIDVKPE
ncbi:MAG: bifunctional phosphopantothenoylcysteine decarboxylase/phosphopantothenate--cysteine ligase CoaBC [Saprospiraceae bacterium]|nr:bifunctional phosphopantothenoylcysteine decarboxylase/phosphopantothenate--cysteine ligase CoaBC [Saprospiraceae bacterium]